MNKLKDFITFRELYIGLTLYSLSYTIYNAINYKLSFDKFWKFGYTAEAYSNLELSDFNYQYHTMVNQIYDFGRETQKWGIITILFLFFGVTFITIKKIRSFKNEK